MMISSWATTLLCFLCSWYSTNTWSTPCCMEFPMLRWEQNWLLREHAALSLMLHLPSLGHDLSWVCFPATTRVTRNLYPQLFLYVTFFLAWCVSAKIIIALNAKYQASQWLKKLAVKKSTLMCFNVLFLNPESYERAWGGFHWSRGFMGAQVDWTDAWIVSCVAVPTNSHFTKAWFASLE